MSREITERLVRNRMKKKLCEDTIHDEKLMKEVAWVLNHRLGSYESSARVDKIEVVSETEKYVTVKAEYAVTIEIPMQDYETGEMYTEREIEYREQTVVIDKE